VDPNFLALTSLSPAKAEIGSTKLGYQALSVGAGAHRGTMDAEELRRRAKRYRQMATQLNDERTIEVLYDLAAEYEALAEQIGKPPRDSGLEKL
jgi:hypothetical protein